MPIDISTFIDHNNLISPARLVSLIIQAMTKHGRVHLYTYESFNLVNCGLFKLLDDLCDHWGWDKSLISITNANPLEKHDEYPIEYVYGAMYAGLGNADLVDKILSTKAPKWNREYDYGLFIGRANATRLQAIQRHRHSRFRNRGLTSFLTDVDRYYDSQEILTFLKQTDSTWSSISDIKPYSDIDEVRPPPIVPPYNLLGWEKIYEKIAIEVVCETITETNAASFSEKLLRPVLYRRPLLLIATDNYRTKAQIARARANLPNASMFTGLRWFEAVIPGGYDKMLGIDRVNCVFDILEELIESGKINTILQDCEEDIEYNYNMLINIIKTNAGGSTMPGGLSTRLFLKNELLKHQLNNSNESR